MCYSSIKKILLKVRLENRLVFIRNMKVLKVNLFYVHAQKHSEWFIIRGILGRWVLESLSLASCPMRDFSRTFTHTFGPSSIIFRKLPVFTRDHAILPLGTWLCLSQFYYQVHEAGWIILTWLHISDLDMNKDNTSPGELQWQREVTFKVFRPGPGV